MKQIILFAACALLLGATSCSQRSNNAPKAPCPASIEAQTRYEDGRTATHQLRFAYEDGNHPYRLTGITVTTGGSEASIRAQTDYTIGYDPEGRVRELTRRDEAADTSVAYTASYSGDSVVISGDGHRTAIAADENGYIKQAEGLGLFSYSGGDIQTIDYVNSFLYSDAKAVFKNVEIPQWFQVYFYNTFIGDNRLLMYLFYSKRRSPSSMSLYQHNEIEQTWVADYPAIYKDYPSKVAMDAPEGSYLIDIEYEE